MKRYWKLGTLTIFIVVILTGFFIQSSFAFSNNPEFVIKHKNGDEKLGSEVVVEGEYNEASRQHIAAITVTQEGSTYLQGSYVSLLQGQFLSPKIKQLQKDYKSFMRGKRDFTQLYDESSDFLAYVNIESETDFRGYEVTNLYFDIDMVDKETEDRTAFTIDFPKEDGLVFSDVSAVQLRNNELNVIANLSFFDDETGMDEEEFHVFTIDVDEQEILNDELIITGFSADDSYTDVQVVEEMDQESAEYSVFMKNTQKEVLRDDGHYEYEHENNEFVSYHLDSGEYETIDLSDEIKARDNLLPIHVQGDQLLLYEMDETELIVYVYNLSNQQLQNKQNYDLPEEITEEVFLTVQEDKVIIGDRLKEDKLHTSIVIYDLNSTEKLYEGTIEIDDEVPNDYELWIHDISLQ